ncbi:protogenin isoform X2 [Erinaceus europaeus]|uniref:Protogenin isoform X2 n=1 Tax=Erinaceus europaeus TaxID=9365 RepID=A0ABM3WC90_ERIEU|nr:protogenin isoform X2 [Erinaceus europaeus]
MAPLARARPPGRLLRALLLAAAVPGMLCFTELFFIKEPQDVTVTRKEPVVLDCQARGEVPIKVTWLKNGAKVPENKRTQVLSNGSLYIAEVEGRRGEPSHEGYYQCLAMNKYGAILSQKAHLLLSTISAFEVQPLPADVQEGGVARFACKISSNPPAAITWELNRTTLPVTTDRITVLPTGVLQIYDVSQRDAGNYRCVASTVTHRRKSTEASLTVTPVVEPASFHTPTIVAGPQNITTSLHQTVVLECVAMGNPRPLISWSRLDHKSIDVFNTRVLGNGNLLIAHIRLQHAGAYVCRATTPGTRNFTVAVATVTVLAPPSFVEWPESLTRPRAGTARFVCQAEGIPSPKMSWLKNGRKMHSNGRIKMYNSKLVINQIIPEDDAIYQCMAENSQGSILSRARLTVVMSEDRPSAPYNVHAETVSSSAILLAWERPLYNADKVIAYSVHYTKAEGLNNEEYQVVIGNDTTHFIIDDLEPASNYTFYIVAYMPVGASQMSDHVTQSTLEDDPRRKYHVRLLAFNNVEDGYQADQTVSTPGCVSVRDRAAPPPPPPHHLYAKANSSASIFLHWRRPAFSTAQTINYTIRCNPVGLQNASLVLYLQTSETHMLVQDLEPNTRYEFAVRLHVDQLSSPWSPVVYHSTLPEAPAGPPVGVKVMLIEDHTALVSWKPPEGPETVVRRYTILYTSRKAWTAGEWQVLHREGAITMALLENLVAGDVYTVKIAASNEVGEGPFSNSVELAVLPKEASVANQRPKRLDSADAKVYSGYYHLDQKSMTGITVGVGIALACILICALILICRSKARKSSASKTTQNGTQPSPCPSASLASGNEGGKNVDGDAENEEPLMSNSFIDAKGGTDLIINSYGPITKNKSKKKWLFFQDANKMKVEQPQRRFTQAVCFYQPGTTVLIGGEDSPVSPAQAPSFPGSFDVIPDTEHSANSEGSRETGDSGRFSHESGDEIHLSSAVSTSPLPSSSSSGSDSAGNPMVNRGDGPTVATEGEQTSCPTVHPASTTLHQEGNN